MVGTAFPRKRGRCRAWTSAGRPAQGVKGWLSVSRCAGSGGRGERFGALEGGEFIGQPAGVEARDRAAAGEGEAGATCNSGLRSRLGSVLASSASSSEAWLLRSG